MKKSFLAAFAAAILSAPSAARAQHVRPGTFEIGPQAGYLFFGNYGAERPENAIFYGVRTGIYMTEHVSFEPTYHLTLTETDPATGTAADVKNHVLRFNLAYHFLPQAVVDPIVTGGLGWNRYESDTPQKSDDLGVNAGVGLRIRLINSLNVRLDGRYEYVETDFSLREHNYEGALSLNYVLGTEPAKDSDGDGVKDKKDQCASTPKGATVDAKGCPSDEDSDGVYNGVDQCPKTFSGFKVDDKGCSMDTDGDTVPDGPDACPDTPKGAAVDAKGCTKDQDGDGVMDSADQCPDTPKGTEVNDRGCPRDSDGDGVLDSADMCPNTQPGTKIDDKGCPLVVKSRGVLKGVNFFSGKAELTPDSLKVLDGVATELAEFPKVNVEVQGHTDATGVPAANLKLSQARAETVVKYLIGKGVDASRLTAKGYGKDKPIASNKTKDGRALNRRVELKWVDPS